MKPELSAPCLSVFKDAIQKTEIIRIRGRGEGYREHSLKIHLALARDIIGERKPRGVDSKRWQQNKRKLRTYFLRQGKEWQEAETRALCWLHFALITGGTPPAEWER